MALTAIDLILEVKVKLFIQFTFKHFLKTKSFSGYHCIFFLCSEIARNKEKVELNKEQTEDLIRSFANWQDLEMVSRTEMYVTNMRLFFPPLTQRRVCTRVCVSNCR